MLIRLEDVSHNYGDFYLFYDVNLVINPSDRIALIGKNGAGKTTLLNIIYGDTEPIEGQVIRKNNLNISILRQYRVDGKNLSIYDFIKEAVLEDYSDYIVDRITRSLLVGVGFSEDLWDRQVSSLSGGELTRLSLARTLSGKNDLLLLDEPTNHLDLYSIEWLINYLRNYKGAMVIVSHDRVFLKELCNRYWEINNSRIWEFKGTYDEYISSREIYINSINARRNNLQKEIQRLEKMIQRYRIWGTEKMMKQAVIRERKLNELKKEYEEIENIEQEKEIEIKIPEPPKTGYKVIEVKNLSFSYDKMQKLLNNISFELYEGEKLAILGKNGCGKTTLLKILMGEISFYSGKIEWGYNIKVGYLDQVVMELSDDMDVLGETWQLVQDWKDFEVRKYLGRFGFYGDEVFKKVKELSGGELTRLALAKILLERPNVLILDEPTNNLDVLTIQSLEKTLKEYKGAIIFVSHDECFIKNIADKFLLIDNGGCIESKNLDNILDNIRSSSFKLQKKKAQNETYKERNRIKNRIKSLNDQLLSVRTQAWALFKSLDRIEAKLFEFGDDYNKIIELMEEKNELEQKLLVLEKMEKEIIDELDALKKNKYFI